MNKVIILLGPTGVGKTGLSLLLAKALNTEIISADSMQVYRRMDIGTAKPSLAERKMITHHMIDIVEPWETYSTGKYIEAVKTIFERLAGQGKMPIVVGGTGLYIKAMTRGIFSGPSADWTLRDQLLALNRETKGILYDSLKALDPEAARNITPNDTRRLIRALEVCLKGGAKMTEFQRSLTRPLPYEFIKIGITRDRRELYRIIEQRVDAMVKGGLIEEVRMVTELICEQNRSRDSGGTAVDKHCDSACRRTDQKFMALPSMQAIGYKEIIRHLTGETTLDEAVDLIKKASKRFAKRQFSWFKKEENIHWIDITGLEDLRDIFDRIYPVIAGLCGIIEWKQA